MFPCPIPGCRHLAPQEKDVIKHVATHTVQECICFGCMKTFGRFDSLDRHVKKRAICKETAKRYQYAYHRHIFSLFYLGLYELFDISNDIFVRLAGRQRLPLLHEANFKFVSFHIEWKRGNDGGKKDKK